jgi:hypothetical protein
MRTRPSAKSEREVALGLLVLDRFRLRFWCDFVEGQRGFVKARNVSKPFEGGGIFRLKVKEAHAAASGA